MIDPSADSTPLRDAATPVSAPEPDLGAQGQLIPASGPGSRTAVRELAFDDLLPLALAFERRRRHQQRGYRLLLYPLPACPACGARPKGTCTSDNMATRMVRLDFHPCGHRFTYAQDTALEVEARAQGIVDQEERLPVGELAAARRAVTARAGVRRTDSVVPGAVAAVGPTLADQVGRPLYDRINAELAKGQRAERLLRDVLRLLEVTHQHGALGEGLGCAGCGVAQQIRDHLEQP